jgi:hypothetical protein
MKMSAKRVVLLMGLVLLLDANLVLADPANDDATASVTVTVADIMEWSGNFSAIALPDITTQTSAPTGSGTATLYTNGNVDITADIVGTEAQLKLGTDPNQTLVTSYMLTDDGDGTNTTGGDDETDYTLYSSFLSSPAYAITHVAGDGAVLITLHAEAKNPSSEVADAGNYSAIQTLTAAWGE